MKSVELAVVGLRFGATVIEELTASPDAEYIHLRSVFDLDEKKTAAVSEKYGARGCKSLEEILSDPEITAVALYTPPAGRAELIHKILDAGKDVMTTKPFELDPAAAEKVLERARREGRTVCLNSPGPESSPLITGIKRLALEKDLGRPVGARCDVWVNYCEQADGGWYDDPERCPVAPVFRLGIYIINNLAELFGEPEKVCALSSRILTGRPTADNADLAVLFKNGAIANVFGSFCVDDGMRYHGPMTINYERGTFYYNVTPGIGSAGGVLSLVTRAGTEQLALPDTNGVYRWDVLARREIMSEEYMLRTLNGVRVMAAMRRAERENAVVEVK